MTDQEIYALIDAANQLCDDMEEALNNPEPPFLDKKSSEVHQNVTSLRAMLVKADPQWAIKNLYGGFGGGA